MKPSEIKTLFDYNFWAFERVWECIAQLSDEQFIQEIDYSTGSIRNIIVHMMTASRIWMNRLKGTEMPPRLIVEDFDSLAKTRAKWDELQHEFLNDLDSFIGKSLGVAGNQITHVGKFFCILPIMPRTIAPRSWRSFIITFVQTRWSKI